MLVIYIHTTDVHIYIYTYNSTISICSSSMYLKFLHLGKWRFLVHFCWPLDHHWPSVFRWKLLVEKSWTSMVSWRPNAPAGRDGRNFDHLGDGFKDFFGGYVFFPEIWGNDGIWHIFFQMGSTHQLSCHCAIFLRLRRVPFLFEELRGFSTGVLRLLCQATTICWE